MNPYYNLPPEQRSIQRLIDKFNADERLWRKPEPKRRARPRLRPMLFKKKLKEFDLLEFANTRLEECVGNGSSYEQ